jgi:hypothetical protein
VVPIENDRIGLRLTRRRRDLAVAPAQKGLAALYAQDQSTVAAADDLATKARKMLLGRSRIGPNFWDD